ncbi:MAG: hypothetical protein JW829_01300 [Pirellulales bacterium]|nr:hypothetical protein [Pirellulales bacterium]
MIARRMVSLLAWTVFIVVWASPAAAAESPRTWDIYLLPHSHVDIGYTKLQTEVEQDHWRFLEQAIEMARNTANYPPGAQFKWNVEVLWAVESYLKQASPQQRQTLIDAVKKGWIGLDALYGNELTALCRPEELLRLVDYAGRLRQRFEINIDSAMISDVAGITWGIVPVLAHGGVRYLSAGPNISHRIGYARSEWDNRPVYWISPCGRHKVLFWQTGNSYLPAFRNGCELVQFMEEFQRKNPEYPYDMLYFRHCLGDNAGPDPNLSEFVKTWNNQNTSVKLQIATTSELFHEFERRYGDAVPSVRGDFTPYWEDGAASSARETALNRAAAERLIQAETLWAMLDPNNYPDDKFYAAWRNVLLYDEHTWGAQSYIERGRYPPGSEGYDAQWKIKQAFALDADDQSRKLLDDAQCHHRSDNTIIHAVDVFNTCSWSRTDLVTLPGNLHVAGNVVRNQAGRDVPSQRLRTGELSFLTGNIRPMAATRFTFHPGQAQAQSNARADATTLSNHSITLTVDETNGSITHLTWKQSDMELVDRWASQGLNDYIYVEGDDPRNAKGTGPVKMMVQEQGPLVVSLFIQSNAPGCRSLGREIRLIDGVDRVDISNMVDKKQIPLADLLKSNPQKEGFYFRFPFNVPDGVVRMEIPWAVVRPELDQLRGACKNWFTVQRWVDVSNQDFGVTWATVDAPMVEIGAIARQPESTHSSTGWIASIAPSQTVYSYVMNNYWTTNYRHDQEGLVTFCYSIEPHHDFDSVRATQFGIERSQPLIAVPVAPDLPVQKPLLTVEPRHVLVTACKPSQDGKAWIVRLLNAAPQASEVTLHWSDSTPQTTWRSNLAEEALSRITGPIEMGANEIITLRQSRSDGDSGPQTN